MAFEKQTALDLGIDTPFLKQAKQPHWLKAFFVGETVQDRPTWVILSGPSITDEDLAPLNELTNLRHLSLRGTKVSETGVAWLSKSLQKCVVHRHATHLYPAS